jgi:hypothetical protein
MRELTLISGRVISVSGYSNTSGRVSSDGNGRVSGSVSTTHTTCMRVGNMAVRFRGTPNVSPGDQVQVVGYHRAELDALAVLNDTTNVTYFGDGAFSSAAAPWIVFAVVVCLFANFLPVAGMLGFFAQIKIGEDEVKLIAYALGVGFCVLGVLSFIRKRALKSRVRSMLGV